jgi:hypothetical protein
VVGILYLDDDGILRVETIRDEKVTDVEQFMSSLVSREKQEVKDFLGGEEYFKRAYDAAVNEKIGGYLEAAFVGVRDESQSQSTLHHGIISDIKLGSKQKEF